MQKYECKVCGGELYWDPDAYALKCKYCDTVHDTSDFDDETLDKDASQKKSEVDKEYTSHSDISDDMVVLKCTECGAEVVASKTTMSTICPYCNRALSVTDKSAGDFRPDKVIPFAIEKSKAIELLTKYTKSSILIPKKFSDQHTIEKTQGLFVPFYLHSFHSRTDAIVSGETSSSHRRGDDKVTTHKVYEVDMDAECQFNDIPTDASKELDDALMDSLEPYSYDKIQDFNPAFMAGYYAEQPDVEVNEGYRRARHKAEKAIADRVLEHAGSYSKKNIKHIQHDYSEVDSKYAMLPVWLMQVEHGGNRYTFAINGETGETVGKLPMSKSKLFGIMAGSYLGLQLITGIIMLIL